jgi:hypothetical protein
MGYWFILSVKEPSGTKMVMFYGCLRCGATVSGTAADIDSAKFMHDKWHDLPATRTAL